MSHAGAEGSTAPEVGEIIVSGRWVRMAAEAVNVHFNDLIINKHFIW